MNELPLTAKQLEQDENLRAALRQLLEGGVVTEVEPRAYSHEQVLKVISRLQQLAENDHENKLVIAGFTPYPYLPSGDDDEAQSCGSCMYYLVHRRFCELPELMLPVDENWSCRLWRI